MVGRKTEPRKRSSSGAGAVRKHGRGHEIVIPEDHERWKRVFVDGRPVHYGTLPDGRYVLDAYAYDPGKTLDEVLGKYLDHVDAAAAAEGRS